MIAAQGIRVYSPPIETDDDASAEHARVLNAAMPFSIIGSTQDVHTADGRTVKGREYLWGVAEGAFRFFSWSWSFEADAVLQLRTRSTAISRSFARCSFARICST